MTLNVSEKAKQFEAFINEKMKPDLKFLLQSRERVYEEVSEYEKLKQTICQLDTSNQDIIKTKVDLGCGFYVQANVPETKTICMLVGLGFYVDYTYPEALKYIDKKLAYLSKNEKIFTEKIVGKKAEIDVACGFLKENYYINNA